jgi:signal transduction histidine kinase
VLRLARIGGEAQVRLDTGPPEVVMGIDGGDQIVGGIHFVFDTAHLEAQITATIRQHLWQAVIALALGIALALYLARRLVQPVRSLTAATRRIASGDLDAAIEASRPDEIGELAVAMQQMSEHLRRSERVRAERQTQELRSANQRLEAEIAVRRRAEREKEALIERLETKTAEMEQFNYTVSHDLKSPLVTIRGFLQEILRSLPEDRDEQIDDDMRRIFAASDRMKELLDDLVEVSRVGRLSRPPGNIDLSLLARETLALMTGPLDQDKPEVSIADDLPTVAGDRDRLLSVFQNLLENALKFSRRDTARQIRIATRRDGDEIVIYVEDNGIGIDPSYQSKIFQIFSQLNPAYPGSGVGLALVKRIIETHNGRIWVESEGVDKGTRFCFTLGQPDLAEPDEGSDAEPKTG